METLNNFTGIGRLTRDPDLSYTPNGTAVAKFSIAINRPFKNKQTDEYDADFINCIIWRKPAETFANHVKKGHRIGIEGRIETGSYENNEGRTIYTTDVVVDRFTFLEQRNNSGNPNSSQPSGNTGNLQQQRIDRANEMVSPQDGQQIDIDDSDLPF